nr:hypothetical protein [uncultured Dyadobacter sp.]
MKAKEKTNKGFDVIKMMRAIKAKMSREMYGMTPEEIQAYLDQKRAKLYSGS